MNKKKAKKPISYVEYNSNNSGGRWWLKDEDWSALEKAGWKVHWCRLEGIYDDKGNTIYDKDGTPKLIPAGTGGLRTPDKDGRWLGALAREAYKPNCTSLREAVEEWERVTGKSSTAAGCPCCGQPHTFTLYQNGKWVDSGPHTSYEASW